MKHQRISEFSASVGVSHTAIRKAINRGRIPANLVRTKDLPSGRKVTFIINPAAARAAFLATTSHDITGSDMPAGDVFDGSPEVADSAGDIPASIFGCVWDEVADLVHEEYEFARTALMAIPARVAAPVAACTDADQVRVIIEAAIRDALDDLTSDIDQYYASDISDIEPETSTPIQLTYLP